MTTKTVKTKDQTEGVATAVVEDPQAPVQELTAEQKEVQEFLPKLQAFLEENKMALQPSLNYSQFGIRPDVGVVKMPEEVKADK